MSKERYDFLIKQNKTKTKTSVERRGQLFKQIKKLLDQKALGVFLLSEINQKGEDLVHYFAINCDKKHSKQLIQLVFENLPGLQEDAEELEKEIEKSNNARKRMVG